MNQIDSASFAGLTRSRTLKECAVREHTKQILNFPRIYSYFTKSVDNHVITSILKAQYVKACIPFFQDETDPDPDHYVLFLVNCCHTTYINPDTIYEVIKDFPPGLIQPPTTITTITTDQPNHPDEPYASYMDDDIAFLHLLANAPEPEPTDTIPTHITTSPPKRPHQSSGSTVQPIPQWPKPTTTHTPIHDQMDVDKQQPDESTTSTTTDDHNHAESFSQPCDFPLFANNSPVESYKLHPEHIPDNQYQLNLAHSQQTRLEVLDALGVAKTISHHIYERTLSYASKHKHIDIDKLKHIATQQPLPSASGAHNDKQAPPHHNHE